MTAQSDLVINVGLGLTHVLCVCVFIKLHITAQSGPRIDPPMQGGINDTCYENL